MASDLEIEEVLRGVKLYTTTTTQFAYTSDEGMVDKLLGLGGRVWGKTYMARDGKTLWYDISIPDRYRETVDTICAERIEAGTLVPRRHLQVSGETFDDTDAADATRAA